MKKTFTLLLFIFSSVCLLGQENKNSIDGNGFQTVFQYVESGNYSGTISGLLIVSKNKQEILLDFQGSGAKLIITKDEDNVYDVSYKDYFGKTTSGKTEVKYQTYGSANSFSLKIDNEWFGFSLIDGACDLIIKGIIYQYKSEKSTEYLVLKVTEKVLLRNHYKNKIRKNVYLLPNSVLVFAIKR